MSESFTFKVAVRIKPLSGREQAGWDAERQRIQSKENQDISFGYERIFQQSESTQQIFDDYIKEDILGRVMSGYDGCIFAYGQTGSGKSYTMLGDSQKGIRGITQMIAGGIFDKIKTCQEYEYLLFVSVVEVYNEDLLDILSPAEEVKGHDRTPIKEQPKLNVRNDGSLVRKDGEKVMVQKRLVEDESFAGALECLDQNRVTASTDMNARSSRSHCVILIEVEMYNIKKSVENPREKRIKQLGVTQEGILKADPMTHPYERGIVGRRSQLNLVDLAGSESQKKTNAKGEREREGRQINKSLLTLCRVIEQLSKTNVKHISFRDSKLTNLLMNSLGGNSCAAAICNVNISSEHMDETRSTLKFAVSVTQIKKQITINEMGSNPELETMRKENAELKAEVLQLRDKCREALLAVQNASAESPEEVTQLREQIARLHQEVQIRDEQLAQKEARLVADDELISELEEASQADQDKIEKVSCKADELEKLLAEAGREREQTNRRAQAKEGEIKELMKQIDALKAAASQAASGEPVVAVKGLTPNLNTPGVTPGGPPPSAGGAAPAPAAGAPTPGSDSAAMDTEALRDRVATLEDDIRQRDAQRDLIIDNKLKRMQELVMRTHHSNRVLRQTTVNALKESEELKKEILKKGGKKGKIALPPTIDPAVAIHKSLKM